MKKTHKEKLKITLYKKLSSEVEIPQTPYRRRTPNNGSLYSLFQSDYFSMELLIHYFNSKTDQSILNFLVQLLYEKFSEESFFYIPQLCILYAIKKSNLNDFILDKSIDSVKFSLKVYWIVSSYVNNSNSSNRRIYDDLLQKIEMTLVNNRRATIPLAKHYKSIRNSNDSDKVKRESLVKESKLVYFDQQISFYAEIKRLCNRLAQVAKDSREEVLNEFLTYLNSLILELQEIGQHKGFILPFEYSLDRAIGDQGSLLIVNILSEECGCFTSKARVPVKITVETIQMSESYEWERLVDKEAWRKRNQDIKEGLTGKSALRVDKFFNRRSSRTGQNENSHYKKKELMVYECLDDFLSKHHSNSMTPNKKTTKVEDYSTGDTIKASNKMSISIESQKIPCAIDKIKLANSERGNDSIDMNKRAIDDIINIINKDNLHNDHIQTKNLETELSSAKYKDVQLTDPFGIAESQLKSNIGGKSIYRNFKSYCIRSFIAKSNDDLRQELLAVQLISKISSVFKSSGIPLKLHPYEILITSSNSGLIEYIPNTISIDSLKKGLPNGFSLNDFFRLHFKETFDDAQRNFTESLAAYSLVSYIMDIKDRHNGNILIDSKGHVIHIDFGFILGISPGGNLKFESAPFKLTRVMWLI